MTDLPEPVASRPSMPEGYGVPDEAKGMLPWSAVRDHLAAATIYWVATTRPDGRPHAVPIWGAWVDDTFYFEGSPETRRGRNLAQNPAVVVHIERGNLAVMVEGDAVRSEGAPAVFERVADMLFAKYSYRPPTGEGMYVVRPRVVMAWDEFPASATRWRFEAP